LASEFFENAQSICVSRLQQVAASNVADPLLSSRGLERLVCMQDRISRHYFHLIDAERQLRARSRGAAKTAGAMLAETLAAERQRLGRELHTGVGQALAGIQLHAGLVEETLPEMPDPVRQNLKRIQALAGVALEQVRGLSRRLYVPGWESLALADALRNLWEASGISEKFAGSLDLGELSDEPPQEVRRAIYLVAQEGISNVIQHANARHVSMSLREEGRRLTLRVADDGSGFRTSEKSDGIGLRSMRDLVNQLGGELRTESAAAGAVLTCSFPVIHD